MRWVTCENPGCDKTKAVNSMPTEDEVFFCSAKCQREAKNKRSMPEVGPRMNVGARSTTAASKRQVRSLDAQIGGKVVPGSGAVPGLDGDRTVGGTLTEEKATKGSSYSLTRATWEKLLGEAGRNGKKALLILDLGPHRIAMLPLDELLTRTDGVL